MRKYDIRKSMALCAASVMLVGAIFGGCSAPSDETADKNQSVETESVTKGESNGVETESAPATDTTADEAAVESLLPGTVSVSGTDFVVNGEAIYLNGVNTPWDKWNDMGGAYSAMFWKTHYALLHNSGINASRVWISCDGTVGIEIDENGYVTGVSDKFWQDCDALFQAAEENGIYVMATLMSFDHFKQSNKNSESYRKMVQDEKAIDAYIENYVIPFCERYDKYDSLFSIDLCNEPDWVHENDECGKLAWDDICMLFAKEAVAIHEHSDILVTIGFGMIKYNSDVFEGNYGSDAYLQSLYADENAYLDFYSTHYYEWEAPWFGFPFTGDPESFKLEATKPALIGEFPATGFTDNTKGSTAMSGSECYVNAYEKGWNGAFAWTSNGVDGCGALKDFAEGAKQVYELTNEK